MKIRLFFLSLLLTAVGTLSAQVTTSSMSGTISDETGAPVQGANVKAVHTASGTQYVASTNAKGDFAIVGMRPGGPYTLKVSYIGYKPLVYENIYLSVADPYTVEAQMTAGTNLGEAVVAVDGKNSGMHSSRSGAITTISAERMNLVPTVTSDFGDFLSLVPQGSSVSGAFAVGGGNFRQSNITVDGAQFNNTFGLSASGILPGGGRPISTEALEQISVSSTPYDVRQSGFNGGAINAVTKSGTNDFHIDVYSFLTGSSLIGKKAGDNDLNIVDSYNRTLGASIGGPIVKNKLFFFINGEYDWNSVPSPTGRAGGGVSGVYSDGNRRPTLDQLNGLSAYLASQGVTTGPWQDYNLSKPSWRIMGRLDWNIDDLNKLSLRVTHSSIKEDKSPSDSRSVGSNQAKTVYGSSSKYGSSYYGLSSLSARYNNNYDFTSVAAELNSRLREYQFVTNTLRATFSYQNQPRSNEYGNQPSVEIVMFDAGKNEYPTWAFTGNDIFTAGNVARTKTFVLTDELNILKNRHDIVAGVQYEMNKAENGYAQAGTGYYAYAATPDQVENGKWDEVFGAQPRFVGITYGNNADHSMFSARMTTHNFAVYLQDNWDICHRFKLSYGLRMELPFYAALKNNFNEGFYAKDFGGRHFRTDQTPHLRPNWSPRVGFNWDVLGNRKLIVRGGTGLFVGRMPYVWLVSSVLNSGMGQTTYAYRPKAGDTSWPHFHANPQDLLTEIGATSKTSIPASPTILGENLKMPTTWKSSLALDMKLPGGIDATIEGIYSKDLNPCVVNNADFYWDGTSTVQLSPEDKRQMTKYYDASSSAYVIENAGKKAYYWSVTAMLHKRFNFGLDLNFSYTHAQAKSYSEGIGDQVSGAYNNYRESVNAVNDHELGYSTYVAPNRVLFTASYKKDWGCHTASTIALQYEGSEGGYLNGFSFARYSYIFSSNVTNDATGPANLIYVPESREALNAWTFADNGTYTADQQRDDFWTYIEQSKYLKSRKGQYAERGGARMPWHNQLNLKFAQDFYLTQSNGRRHTLTVGMDVVNLLNALNRNWGTYKMITGNALLTAKTNADGTPATFQYNMVNGKERHVSTSQDYANVASTWQICFNLRYTF